MAGLGAKSSNPADHRVATDADTKLVPHWRLGARNLKACYWFMHDLAERLEGRFQLTTDGFSA